MLKVYAPGQVIRYVLGSEPNLQEINNERRWRVAERAGFTLEGMMRKQQRDKAASAGAAREIS